MCEALLDALQRSDEATLKKIGRTQSWHTAAHAIAVSSLTANDITLQL